MRHIITTIKELDIAKKCIPDYKDFNWVKAYDAIRLLRFQRARCPDCGAPVGYIYHKERPDDFDGIFVLGCSDCQWFYKSANWDGDIKKILSLPSACDLGNHKYSNLLGRQVCIRCGEWK